MFQWNDDADDDDGICTWKERYRREMAKKSDAYSIRIKADTVDLWNRRFFMPIFFRSLNLLLNIADNGDFMGGFYFQWNRQH